MATRDNQGNRHLFPRGTARAERFELPPPNIEQTVIPARNRRVHGGNLLSQLASLRDVAEVAREEQKAIEMEGPIGLQVEFESFPDIELAFESLARENQGIELLNVRHDGTRTYATVFVPDGKLDHFEQMIFSYLEERRDRRGRPLDHRRLIDAVREIRAATLRALWTDDAQAFPSSDAEGVWWEVWLPVRGKREQVLAAFRDQATRNDIRVSDDELRFPERTVMLAYASVEQMQSSLLTLNTIAELRRAKETAEFFDNLDLDEQPAWLDELLSRTRYSDPADNPPYICVLDTGVVRGHPFLAPALATSDLTLLSRGGERRISTDTAPRWLA